MASVDMPVGGQFLHHQRLAGYGKSEVFVLFPYLNRLDELAARKLAFPLRSEPRSVKRGPDRIGDSSAERPFRGRRQRWKRREERPTSSGGALISICVVI